MFKTWSLSTNECILGTIASIYNIDNTIMIESRLINIKNGNYLWINWFLTKLGKEKYSFSKKIKNNVKNAIKFIGDFENAATELAIKNEFDYVICGHIHQPQIREVESKNGNCVYLNSGDWIENLTALEYHNKNWSIYTYNKYDFKEELDSEHQDVDLKNIDELIKEVISFN